MPNPRPSNEDRVRAALWFADRGFGVFPVWSADDRGVCRCPKGADCDNAGKHPITARGFRDATSDAARIRTFLSAASEPNYGLVCPDGVFALDVDGEGVERVANVSERLGKLPPTLRTRTAHGWHVFLRWPEDHPRPLGQLWGLVTRWGNGQNAGYVIGPRSVHASGAEYAPDGDAFEIATLPEAWAADAVGGGEPEPFIEISAGGYQLPDYGYTGSRYDAILRFVGSRYMRGIPLEEIWTGVVYHLAPRFEHPLEEAELRSRFERAWKGTARRLGEPMAEPAVELGELATNLPALPALAVPGWPEPPAAAAFRGILGEIVEAVAPVTEADPAGILGTLLAATGACLGHMQTLYQGSTQAANLFVVLVGDTALGRKGTAASVGRDVMALAYPEWERLIVTGLGSGEGLVAHLKAITEAQDLAKRDHRALVLESEFGRLLTVMEREGSTLSPVIRDAWDGSAIGRFTAREQSLVPFHHVAIAAHVTREELRSKLATVEAANGFGNRFLWMAVRQARIMPFPSSPRPLVEPFAPAIRAALESAQVPRDVHWSSDATDRWEAFYVDGVARRRLGLIGALTARREAQVARIALLYALLDRAASVGLEHLEAAIAVWEFAERSALFIFGDSTGSRHADALRDMVGGGPVEWETAKRALGLRTAADLRDAVDVLVSAGIAEVVEVPRKGGGRPVRVIRTRGRTTQTVQTTQGSNTREGA